MTPPARSCTRRVSRERHVFYRCLVPRHVLGAESVPCARARSRGLFYSFIRFLLVYSVRHYSVICFGTLALLFTHSILFISSVALFEAFMKDLYWFRFFFGNLSVRAFMFVQVLISLYFSSFIDIYFLWVFVVAMCALVCGHMYIQ